MTMEEVIEHSEAVVRGDLQPLFDDEEVCREYIEEQRLIATWLKELRRHREAWVKVITEIKEYQKDAFYYDYVTITRKQMLEVINKYKPKEGDVE